MYEIFTYGCFEFEPTEHVTVAKVTGGSVETHSPPDDLEAIHGPS